MTKILATVVLLTCFPNALSAQSAASAPSPPPATSDQKSEAILRSADATPLLPATVFFRGQTAPLQTRNSGGVRFADGSFVLFALVDASGYSSSIREKYQAYLLSEVPLDVDGHRLPPGAYGFGFLANDSFVVMDIGGHDLFTAKASKDATLHRPTPLQVLPGETPTHYKLFSGRTFIPFSRASN